MSFKNHKLQYKLYQPDGTFIKSLNQEDILSSFQVNKTINGGIGALKVVLSAPIDNYDEYDAVKNPTGSIKYGNRLKVFLNDTDNTDKQIFYGYLVDIGPQYSNGKESVELLFYEAVSKLSNDCYNTAGSPPYEPTEPAGFYAEETMISTSTIIKNILDSFRTQAIYPMVSYTWGTSIKDCGNLVSYTFDRVKHLDSIRKIEEYLPATWYWYVDGEGIMNVKDSSVQTEHKLTIGKNIREIKAHKTIQSVINYFILWNGRSTADDSYVFRYKSDVTSQNDYDRITLFQQDSAVLDDSVADIRKDKVIAYRKDPKQELTIEVTDEYDLASLEPGQRVSIRNIRDDTQTTFADGLVIVRVSYKVDSALLELGQIGADFVKATSEEETAINNSIKQAQSATEDIQSGTTPITYPNIEYGGASFIKEDIIYSPVIAGINGYFRDSIRLGANAIGSEFFSYGKTGFNDASKGFWLEKTSLNHTKFELYYDINNYFRVNTQTGLFEIAGDIILGPGTTITWAQISNAIVPNSPDLSDFNNDNSWTSDANLDLFRNGALPGGTFIASNVIYSPVIAGAAGYFSNMVSIGASGIGGILRSYGKSAYGDSFTGFWLEKTAAGRIMFELYRSATAYFKFDSSGSPVIDIRGRLYADDIYAGTINGSVVNVINLNAGNIITGSLTGIVVQTTASANRGIKLTTSYLRAWDSSGNQTFNLDTSTGALKVYTYSTAFGGYGYELYYSGTMYARMNAYGVVVRYRNAFSAASNYTGDLGNDWFRFLCDTDPNFGSTAGLIQAPNTNYITFTTGGGSAYGTFQYSGSKKFWSFSHWNPYSNLGYNMGDSTHHWATIYCQNISYAGQLKLWMTTSLRLYEGGSTVWSLYINGTDSYMGAGQLDAKIASSRNFTIQSPNIWLVGSVWKSGGFFTIDHPLKPDTHFLCHSFVESPERLNLYRGNAILKDGRIKIKMPDWFIALNGNNIDDFSYQLTSIGKKNDLWIEEEINAQGEFIIGGEKDLKVSYIIMGTRHDIYAEENQMEVEVEKESVGKKGEYMYPQYYAPKDKKVISNNNELWLEQGIELEVQQSVLSKANIIK